MAQSPTHPPKKFIAWDTSSKTGVIAAFEAQGDGIKLRSEWSIDVDASRSEILLWGVDHVLSACGWEMKDLEAIGVGVGPGSFTGLRIGVTTARMLALALQKKLVAVSSLEALVRPVATWAQDHDPKAWVIGAIDASKGDWFVLQGEAKRLAKFKPNIKMQESVMAPDQLEELVKAKLKKVSVPWIAIGQAVDRYPQLWAKYPKKRRLAYPFMEPSVIQGRYLAQVVWEHYQVIGARDPKEIFPRYLRASSAELQMQAKKGFDRKLERDA